MNSHTTGRLRDGVRSSRWSRPRRVLRRSEAEERSSGNQTTGIVAAELDRLAIGSTHRDEPRGEPMTAADTLERGRDALQRQAWADAYALMSVAQRTADLEPEDLERLALAAYLVGNDDDCAAAWLGAHQGFARRGDIRRAARCAFWQACGLLFRGELAPAMGWIARGRRVLEAAPQDCAERGWLVLLTALPVMFEGDAGSAHVAFVQADEIAERCGDLDLAMFARLGRGWSLILQQHVTEGMALLDEVMVAVVAGELSPILTGIFYCSTIDVCQSVLDLRRAREWTGALSRWCDAQPDLVPFRGNCLVHRCEIFQLQGAWHDALDAGRRACELLSPPPTWDSLGWAYYQLGEIHRLRGEVALADTAYRQASRAGRDPEPGRSLLLLAQGADDAAAASIRRVLDETLAAVPRAKVLPAYIDIMLAANDVDAGRVAVDELRQIADELSAPYVRALAAHAAGAVLLAEGDARAALVELRGAAAMWREHDVPYQVARARVLVGLACRQLGDDDGAALEFDTARGLFEDLDATPDLTQLRRLSGSPPATPADGLSPREREVLALLATGKTNRAIAAELFLSEKTIARHVSNIFAKLALSSRAEATAYAYTHGLVP
jgi:DNA-binding CsgD family transcriptional regulator